ncbi:hypothetical protein [Nocardia exalbida]|uniref:hypothetical protein n=1 Tax=Nocardia exalbida TaxID=290231 RepID=UPI0002F8F5B9|nr:hypothetical protein [Nocardia exalbida]
MLGNQLERVEETRKATTPQLSRQLTPPVVASIIPSFGPATGALIGTGFSGVTAVNFFGHPEYRPVTGTRGHDHRQRLHRPYWCVLRFLPAVSFTVNSDAQITAVTPLAFGAAPITVTTPGGIATGLFL